MTKQEFITELRKKLSGLPKQDIDERLNFYGEMIDDRIEEGRTEEEAVLEIGSVDKISAQIIADIPLIKIVKERIKPKRRLKAWEIVLLVLGSPIWLSLAVAAFAVIFSLYAALWSVIVSLWAVFASLTACSVGSIIASIFFAIRGNYLTAIAILSAGIVCAGLSFFILYTCKATTKGILVLTKKLAVWNKNCFIKKEKS